MSKHKHGVPRRRPLRRPNHIARHLLLMLSVAGCVRPLVTAPERAAPAEAIAAPSDALSRTEAASYARSLFGRIRPAQPLDESIGLRGSMGMLVNNVVPIPGTDMIKVGAVQEGTLFQTSFRNPTQDAHTPGSSPTGAAILFHVNRP